MLIVEDEPLVRMLAVDAAEDAGLAVIEAARGDDALRLLESRADIGAVFTDINLPGIDGLQLAALIRERWPDIGVAVTSGHWSAGDVAISPFVAKPYDPQAVGVLLRSLLGSDEPGRG